MNFVPREFVINEFCTIFTDSFFRNDFYFCAQFWGMDITTVEVTDFQRKIRFKCSVMYNVFESHYYTI